MMKSTALFVLLFLFSGVQEFDRAQFYAALADDKISATDHALEIVKAASVKEKDAYEGTLMMRKSGTLSVPAQKLKLFKEGRIKLETAIAKDTANGEYRFLRLIIQEHAPKITKYSKQLTGDKQVVLRSYASLPSALQAAIVNYSKTSAVLRPEDF